MNQGNSATEGAATSTTKKVLLLEDDFALCEALKAWFEMNDFVVTVVHRGVEGLTEVMKTDFDAIVCDMVMPMMPGDMFYLAVGKVRPHLCERFIFITGHKDDPNIAKFLWEFCGPTFHKPLHLEDLMAAVRHIMSGNSPTAVIGLGGVPSS
jgi:DNA-binding response OmpR family regulator